MDVLTLGACMVCFFVGMLVGANNPLRIGKFTDRAEDKINSRIEDLIDDLKD